MFALLQKWFRITFHHFGSAIVHFGRLRLCSDSFGRIRLTSRYSKSESAQEVIKLKKRIDSQNDHKTNSFLLEMVQTEHCFPDSCRCKHQKYICFWHFHFFFFHFCDLLLFFYFYYNLKKSEIKIFVLLFKQQQKVIK